MREHRNRPLDELGPQAIAILVTALRRAGVIESDAPFVELLRADADGTVDAIPVEIRERPPIDRRVPGYRARFGRELDAPDRPTSAERGRPASTAASSTSSAARVNASPACHTRSVSASTCTSRAIAERRRARRR